jgi:hypothetical protein
MALQAEVVVDTHLAVAVQSVSQTRDDGAHALGIDPGSIRPSRQGEAPVLAGSARVTRDEVDMKVWWRASARRSASENERIDMLRTELVLLDAAKPVHEPPETHSLVVAEVV